MSGGGLGSTGVTQSGGGSSFGMNQPSQGMGQSSPQPMQQPMQGPFGGLGNMQVSPYNSTSQQNIFGGQQGMGQGFQQPMQQGPFGGQFGNMFGGPQFGFQQPQPFYQQQFNPYAMASQAQGLGISQVPIRNQYGPYGGQMFQQPYQMPYRNPMQQPMQQSQTNYPQPMGYPQPMQDSTSQQAPYGGFGNEQSEAFRNALMGQSKETGYIQPKMLSDDSPDFDMTGQNAIRQQRTAQSQRAVRSDPTATFYRPQVYPGMPQQSAINFQQLIQRKRFNQPSRSIDDLSNFDMTGQDVFRRSSMPRHMMPPEMQGPDVSDTIVDTGKVDMTSPAEAPMTAQDILKMAVGKSTPDLRYDSNGDGKITSADALAFQRSMQQKGMA